MEIKPKNIKNKERFFEELSMNAHPSLRTQLYDGWVLRFSNGYTKRANSVNPIYPPAMHVPLSEKIESCEKIYFSQNLPAIFKITPALSGELDGVLESGGYGVVEPTSVMTMSLKDFSYASNDFIVADYAGGEWLNSYFSFGKYTDKIQVETAKQMLNSVQNTMLCGLIVKNGEAVACGSCVIERGCAALLNIVVEESRRGAGHGYGICASLLNEAAKRGAENTYLQVVQANSKAVNLYAKLGYKKIYEYWYRKKAARAAKTPEAL